MLGDEFECGKEVVWNGPVPVIGHPDAIHKNDGAVIEFKTTESTRVIKEGPYSYHIAQTKAYMTLLNAPYSKILYLILGYPNVKEYFPEYLVTFSYKNEPRAILTKLEADAAELQRAIDQKDPSLVGHIGKHSDYIRFGRNWLCANCPYEKQCTQMRADAGEFSEQVRRDGVGCC